jgi:TetR/AcrR family transcriptional regulator
VNLVIWILHCDGYAMKPKATVQSAQPARKREAQRQGTRLAILDAAIDSFAARGFEGTSLPQVASTCGFRVSLILYHFETKRALWEACVAKVYAEVEARLDAAMPEINATTGIERIRIAVASHIRAAAAHPAFHRILFQEAMHKTDRLEWLVEHHQRAMSNRIVALIDEAKAAGLIPAGIPSMHLKFVISGMFALPIAFGPEYMLLTNEDPNDPAFIDRHVTICLGLLSGGHAS